MLGPALMVAGIALWAFVVFGTYTTSWLPGGDTPLNGTLAVVVAAIITMRAWVVCVRRDSPDPFAGPHGMIGRYVSVGVVAFGFWTFAVSFATFVGRTSPANLDIFIAGALLLVSALSLVAGHRMTGRAPSKRSSARRLFVLAGWFAAGLMTLGSCVELVAEH